MKIVVLGGPGLVGRTVVHELAGAGHEVVAAAPSTGVDAVTGEGLAEALEGASVVVDVSNSPSFAAEDALSFFTAATRNVLAAGTEAGVVHHVVLSVVGSRRMTDGGYLRAKVAQEDLVAASGTPFSIVHATQFFEFASSVALVATADDGTVHLPPAAARPIAADEVGRFLAETALGAPVGSVELAGPEVLDLDEFVRSSLAAAGDERVVVTDEAATYFGVALEHDTLLPGDGAVLATTRLADRLTTSV